MFPTVWVTCHMCLKDLIWSRLFCSNLILSRWCKTENHKKQIIFLLVLFCFPLDHILLLVFQFFVLPIIFFHYLFALQVAKSCFVPALLGHAIDDDFIQPHHSDRIFEAYMVSVSTRVLFSKKNNYYLIYNCQLLVLLG